MALQELQIYGLWAGKQTAKGTANAAPATRFKQVSGGFNIPRDDGSENFSDGTAFPDTFDWVNSIIGNGNPGIQATPNELAWLLWAFQGGETTSAVAGPPAKTKHTAVPLPGLGHWLTFATRLGSSQIDRLQHNDCQIGQVQVEGSTANKRVLVTPTVISLDPGEQRAADPAAAMPTKNAFLYTDGTSRFTIDGTVFRGHSQFTLVVNKDLNPVYADDVTVYDLSIGNAVITIAVTLYFDADGRAQFNKLVYGTAAPAAGSKPLKTLSPMGSAGAVNGDKFVTTLAGVKWAVPDAPDPNPDGGAGELALAGATRKSGVSPQFQIDIDNDAAAYTV
jgi:hypothetical protein